MVESLGHGRFAVIATAAEGPASTTRRVQIAYAIRENSRVWVFMDGRTYLIEPDTPERVNTAHPTDDHVALSAPMPATVLAVEVKAGQQVAAGDLLVLLEAMKMEVPITAPRPGRVKSIACRTGELVQPGVPLLEIDEEYQG